jgi:2-polyprenyl-3-methyl-5-hydroxy-6-metoxy-1,4-benzoquinol methylase
MYTQRFIACPLCDTPVDSAEVYKVSDASSHPLYKPELPSLLRWLRCHGCDHVFTENYWNEEGERLLFSSALAYQLPDSSQSEYLRKLWAPVVRSIANRLSETRTRERVFGAGGGERPRWIDVGFGNGGLVMTADEFGFASIGVDVRAEAVQRLAALGYGAICARFEELEIDRSLAVLSMADALEHMPDPRAALRKAHAMLDADGLLYLSCPNSETSTWRLWDQTNTNPYWAELEHYHNFSRASMLALLDAHGFNVVNYDVSVRYYSCMEITARKRA